MPWTSVSDPIAGRFSDGHSAAQHPVTLTVQGHWLIIATEAGPVARWPCEAVRLRDGARQTARSGIAVLVHGGEQVRLDSLAALAALRPALARLTAPTARQSRDRRATVRWLGGIAGTLAALYLLLPHLAAWGAGLIPAAWQEDLGRRAEAALLLAMTDGAPPPPACADSEDDPLLARTAQALATAAGLHPPPRIRIYPVAMPNAFALPGNRIILTRGLLARLQNAEQGLAVLAHETAHLAQADPMAAMLQHLGWGLAVQTVFGTGVSPGIAEMLPLLAYHRDIERRADREGARYLAALGRSPKLMGEALRQLPEGPSLAGQWLSTHPDTADRAAAMAALPDPDGGSIALAYSPREVGALRRACGV